MFRLKFCHPLPGFPNLLSCFVLVEGFTCLTDSFTQSCFDCQLLEQTVLRDATKIVYPTMDYRDGPTATGLCYHILCTTQRAFLSLVYYPNLLTTSDRNWKPGSPLELSRHRP